MNTFRTHIDTLADNTPKSRRRIRRLLAKWPPEPYFGHPDAHATAVAAAQDIARRRELAGAKRAAERAGGKST